MRQQQQQPKSKQHGEQEGTSCETGGLFEYELTCSKAVQCFVTFLHPMLKISNHMLKAICQGGLCLSGCMVKF